MGYTPGPQSWDNGGLFVFIPRQCIAWSKFNEDPTVFSAYGYNIMEAFISAAQKAGPNLTTESFIKAMDTLVMPPDFFGGPQASFGPQKRLGSNLSRLSQIQDGRWKVVTDYVGP